LFTLCDIKTHGNTKVSFTLFVSTPKAKVQHKETKNMLKLHGMFLKKMTLYFRFHIFLVSFSFLVI
jgi:hypothetical protein